MKANHAPAQPYPAPPALTDADLSALHSMAQAQCERGSPDACCVVAAWKLLALTADEMERRRAETNEMA